MPSSCTSFQDAQIRTLLESGTPAKKVGALVNPPVSYTKVLKVRRNLKLHSSAKAPRIITQGRPLKITSTIADALREVLIAKPSSFIDELVWFIYDEFDKHLSEVTIRRWLRKEKYTKKILQRRAKERCQDLRDHWYARLSKWDANQVVFLDESAANERTADRKYGWAPIGVTPIEYIPIKRSERWSILPAYTIDGYIAYEIIQGSFNTERFNNFVSTKLLPLTTAFPGPRSVIVVDNASIHRNPELVQMCLDAGVLLEYLPPYSPDFNPIEKSFSDLKKWMRRNRELAIGYGTNFGGFLELAVEQISSMAKGHFRACHIQVVGLDSEPKDELEDLDICNLEDEDLNEWE